MAVAQLPIALATLQCPPPTVPREDNAHIRIVDVMFEGSQLSSLGQIADSLKERTYTGSVEGITSELEERVRRALQERGFFTPQVSDNTRVLTSSPIETQVAVAFHVVEGKQYHLAGIRIRNNHAIGDAQALRDLIPVKDGELFNRTHIEEGLERLKNAYSQQGYINFTVVPETKINEDDNSVWLELDLDEGKVFYVSNIDILGVDEQTEHRMLQDFLLKPGDIYSQARFDLSIQRLSPPNVIPVGEKRMDERAGTVAFTISFGRCPDSP
ncbi:MAG TPA: POTRA domain-containing protein [Terriglobales bacterium]|nr:POTRA domain-containing protein [Terriglobales bacterium]